MSDDVCDILTMAGRFKSYSDLHLYSDKQFVALQRAAEKIERLNTEIEHLKSLLMSTTQLLPKENKVEEIIVTPEEAICNTQINLLNNRAMQGSELTLEEIKKLDLLIKNKRLAKEQNTTIVGESKPITTSLTSHQLLQIASKGEKSEPVDA